MWQVRVHNRWPLRPVMLRGVAQMTQSADTRHRLFKTCDSRKTVPMTGTPLASPTAPDVAVVFSAERIAARLEELAVEIAARQIDRLLVIAVLKGSFVFAADLIRAMHRHHIAPEIDFLTLSSYRKSRESSGQVTILRDLDLDVANRNLLLIDDILESGRTLAYAKDLLTARGASSILTCVLLEKAVPRAVDVEADFKAFMCPEVFVVGYGMDVAHRYRELPFVGHITRAGH
jgi:hypoxanthine phosphoribosyltransferase